ncbi:hypothetical protein [Nocardioides sp. SLBN-35]|uniref:hypothetical protein n=1 Tax=Nocardioides sp. SLBN-35 TaxID=2768445 RepID=UPI00114E771A|nr:hypothetical protein [Nocardioides sp. SLBN-35]TQK71540.1 hypothetical protein FBY23_3338 [Nocardioides sp. SLBN-35]
MTERFVEHGTPAEILDVIAQLPALPYAARGDQLDWSVAGHEGESFDRMHVFGLASHPDRARVHELATRLAVAADQRWGKRHRFACAAVTPKGDPAHILDPRAVPAAALEAMGATEAEFWRFGDSALLLAVNPDHVSGAALCVALVLEASYLEKPVDRLAVADAEMYARIRKAGKGGNRKRRSAGVRSELLEDFLSRDKTRINSAIDVVNGSGDAALLAPVAAELRAVLASIRAADFVIVDGNPVELAVDRLEIVRSGGCLCATYPRRSADPQREADKGWVRIESETVSAPGARPRREVACTSCGSVFDVEEGEYHATWWKWVLRGRR